MVGNGKIVRVWSLLAACVGVALILIGIAIGWKISISQRRGEDFSFLYTLGEMTVNGDNAYNNSAVANLLYRQVGEVPGGNPQLFYPPSTGLVMAPLTVLPYHLARYAWFALLVTATLAGAWLLLATVAPKASPSTRLLLVGIVMASSSIRWGLLLFQPTPLVFGLLGLFIAALARKKT